MLNSSPPRRASVFFAQSSLEEQGHLSEQFVSGKVATVVVDLLEAVEVEKEHCKFIAASLNAGQRLLESVLEFAPVEKAGQCIVSGLEGELGRSFFYSGLH